MGELIAPRLGVCSTHRPWRSFERQGSVGRRTLLAIAPRPFACRARPSFRYCWPFVMCRTPDWTIWRFASMHDIPLRWFFVGGFSTILLSCRIRLTFGFEPAPSAPLSHTKNMHDLQFRHLCAASTLQWL